MSKLSTSTTIFASLQWLFFIFANTLVVPLSVGAAFHLSAAVIAVTLRTSFIFIGIACALQGMIGHRFSLMEGHSGLWWGLILSLCSEAAASGMTYTRMGGALATGIILAGVVSVLIGWLNLIPLLQKLFTPMVMSIYLFLLSIELILIFFKGMLKFTSGGSLDLPVSLFSLALVIITSVISIKGKGMISNFAVLIGIIVGWVIYSLIFGTSQQAALGGGLKFTLFPWGKPNFEIGIVLTAFITGLLNLTNNISSIKAAEGLYGYSISSKNNRSSFIITGLLSMVSTVFGLVPNCPYASSLGLLESTRILDRKPLIIGGLLFAVMGLVGPLVSFFTTLPVTVGNAVLFVAYMQLFGTAMKSMKSQQFNSKTIFRFAMPLLLGVSIMNLSPVVFSSFPMLIQPLISNGLIMGLILAIILEMSVKWEAFEEISEPTH
ncbi:uracil/xanthine transporter [Neobacillus pocheonensis]|uniref:Uracil/xanthine transporter n=1 Tax=Neobacillus pocheonensis TaxID=363869 RepID=A0ABT0W4H9_9BACI|nr:uracil/xanthine transporter [Neobacillus pocheonensis]